MEQKLGAKQIAAINLINNIPMAIVMSTAAPLLGGQSIELGNWLVNVVVAFFLACIINIVVPVAKIANGFPKVFKLDPKKIGGRIVGNLPVCLIFVLIIGLILTFYNVRVVPGFLFAFLATFLPLYVICFVVSMITNPMAMKAAGLE